MKTSCFSRSRVYLSVYDLHTYVRRSVLRQIHATARLGVAERLIMLKRKLQSYLLCPFHASNLWRVTTP